MTGTDSYDDWQLSRLLVTVGRLVEQNLAQELRRFDLTPAGLGVLEQLASGPMSQRDLARATLVEDQTMTQVLDRLERLGMVQRAVDPDDRRRHRVSATRKGTSALRAAAKAGSLETTLEQQPGAGQLRKALAETFRRLSAT